jgi:hypothetical protein
MEHHAFNTRVQEQGESIQAYVSDLKIKAGTCKFETLKDEMIRDRLVVGIRSDAVRKLMLREEKLTLEKAIQICEINEVSDQRMKLLSNTEVDSIKHSQKQKSVKQKGFKGQNQKQQNWRRSNFQQHDYSAPPRQSKCRYCGYQHPKWAKCPAEEQQCKSCGRMNHFAKVCWFNKKGKFSPGKQQNEVHEFKVGDMNCDDIPENNKKQTQSNWVIDTVTSVDATSSSELYRTVQVHGNHIRLKVDSGADGNVLPNSVFEHICLKEEIDQSEASEISGYFGTTSTSMGTTVLPCKYKDIDYDLKFMIIDKPVKPVIGFTDSVKLGIIVPDKIFSVKNAAPTNTANPKKTLTHEQIMSDYSDLFSGKLGQLPVTYKMKLDPNVPPVINPPRRLPIAMEDKVKDKLDDMVKIGVIAPVSTPTAWVSSMVAVNKKDKDDVRICIDPKNLNCAIQREHYPMRTIEDIVKHMPNAAYFTVLDASNAYWQIPLDEKSSYCTTFSTPYGRYRFTRMPFGIKSASEVFQKAIDHLFAGCPCASIVDDLLIWGSTESEHDARLIEVLDRAREINLQLKLKKCAFKVSEVKYVGHVLSKGGLRADPDKVKSIIEMEIPENCKSLQRFLGMVTYLGKFVPQLSQIAAPLRDLTKKDSVWVWDSNHQKAFDDIKSAIANPPVLKFYDPNLPVTLQCDSSQSGMGAAIIQQGVPIAYASKALTPTHQRYAQIEKELLAVQFGCEKFDDFLYGHTVNVESDHKPLEMIFRKPLHSCPIRLQKMLLKLQRYDLVVRYKRGAQMYVADTLSRAYLKEEYEEPKDYFEVLSVEHFTSEAMSRLQSATLADPVLQMLAAVLQRGWPDRQSDVHPEIRSFHAFRDQLCIHNEVIFKGEKVIVPESLRIDYIRQLHSGHCGKDGTKKLARDFLYWPSLASDIDHYVDKCAVCNINKAHQQREPLLNHQIPVRPWSIVASDLFTWQGSNYLVLVDSYSGWIEVDSLTSTTSQAVITKMKKHFSRFGIPDELQSDNGPQYSSAEFHQFAKQYGFAHVTSSPTYAQSNGLAENAVKQIKQLFGKCKADHSDPYLGLLNMRNIPRDNFLGSPASSIEKDQVSYTNEYSAT